jgi:hypothetical protein
MPGFLKRLMDGAQGPFRAILLLVCAVPLAASGATVSIAPLTDGEPAFRAAVPGSTLGRYPSGSFEAVRTEALNRATPFHPDRILPARPFVLLSATAGSQALSAVDCLTAAVYYEAGNEPLDGQRAVAQVVLNRVRHPAFPGAVCDVVFEGAARTTGCQFTFTCDGSLMRTPRPEGWKRAQSVAIAALSGYVEPSVGHATHYHANYVLPYWADRLVKLHSIGAHVFYLWPGSAGNPRAFAQKYTGHETLPTGAAARLTVQLLSSPSGPTDLAASAALPAPAAGIDHPDAIASTPGTPTVPASTAPPETMLEKGGQLRVAQGKLKDDLAAPRPIIVAPRPVSSPQ